MDLGHVAFSDWAINPLLSEADQEYEDSPNSPYPETVSTQYLSPHAHTSSNFAVDPSQLDVHNASASNYSSDDVIYGEHDLAHNYSQHFLPPASANLQDYSHAPSA